MALQGHISSRELSKCVKTSGMHPTCSLVLKGNHQSNCSVAGYLERNNMDKIFLKC